jgi:hypothetical protein
MIRTAKASHAKTLLFGLDCRFMSSPPVRV